MKYFRRLTIAVVVLALVSTAITGCTSQDAAKEFGGTVYIDLPAGKKLVVATWKNGSNLWYLVRDRREGEKPETHEFLESSNYGFFNGKVIFREQ